MVTRRFSQRGLNTRSKAAGDQYLNSVEPQGIVYAAVYCIVTVQRARRPPLLSLGQEEGFPSFPIRKFKLHLLPTKAGKVTGAQLFSKHQLTHAGCEAYAQLFRIVIIIISSSRNISTFYIIYRGSLGLVLPTDARACLSLQSFLQLRWQKPKADKPKTPAVLNCRHYNLMPSYYMRDEWI